MTDNDDLFHNSKHNLRQFKEAKFYQISSINSKFNELKFFFALLLGLKNAKVEKKKWNEKNTVLTAALNFHNKLIDIYTREYNTRERNPDYDPKKLEEFVYAPVQQ